MRDRPPPRRRVPHDDALSQGELFPNVGCYLEVVENQRLVWTDALAPGYRPAEPKPEGTGAPNFFLTAAINLARAGKGTKHIAHCMHSAVSGRDAHEKMGFFEGWSTVLDQLVEVMKEK